VINENHNKGVECFVCVCVQFWVCRATEMFGQFRNIAENNFLAGNLKIFELWIRYFGLFSMCVCVWSVKCMCVCMIWLLSFCLPLLACRKDRTLTPLPCVCVCDMINELKRFKIFSLGLLKFIVAFFLGIFKNYFMIRIEWMFVVLFVVEISHQAGTERRSWDKLFACHHLHEFIEVDCTGAISINFSNQAVQFSVW